MDTADPIPFSLSLMLGCSPSAGWDSLETGRDEVVGNSVEDTCSFLVSNAGFRG